MKKYLKLFGIVVLVTAVGFSIASCGDDKNPLDPVENAALDGLWWNETLITQTPDEGTPGVWVFNYPNFWRLNGWGYARKGTFTISGEIEKDGSSKGVIKLTLTRKKDDTTNWSWADADAGDIAEINWTLSTDGKTLKGLADEADFVKTTWDAAENSEANNGPWEKKINDPALDTLIPPPPQGNDPEVYGWLANGSFKLPPFYEQTVATEGAIEKNEYSATRDLMTAFVLGMPVPAEWSVGTSPHRLTITSNGVDGKNTRLMLSVLTKAQYIVFKLGDDFTEFPNDKNFIIGWWGGTASETYWGHSNAGAGFTGPFYSLITNGVLNEEKGVKFDSANKLLVIELEKAVPMYELFKTETALKPIFGSPSGQDYDWVDDLGIEACYLVNIVE